MKANTQPELSDWLKEYWVKMQDEFNAHKPAKPKANTITSRLEVPVVNGTGMYKAIVGYWDLQVDLNTEVIGGEYIRRLCRPPTHTRFYVEVKPKIESLGALLRQINLYRQYSEPGPIFIYTPDTRFNEQLKSQDIDVIEATPCTDYYGGVRLT